MVKTFQKYMNKNELIQQWDGTQMLEGMDESLKEKCATLLQAQIGINENHNEKLRFKRISVPIARRLFNGIDIDTSLTPLSKWTEVAKWPEEFDIDKSYGNLDYESNITLELTETIIKSLKEKNITKIHGFKLEDGIVEVNHE